METLEDVINWFESERFIINPLITIAVRGGRYYAPKILAILIWNDKNAPKRGYLTKSSYINYLREEN